jgi:hypothetical protein
MVRRLLILAAGASTAMGCLLSNPPDFEEPVEHPPVVVQRSPLASILAVDRDDTTSPTTTFQAVVSDANVNQVLFYRWFLDFHPDASPQCGLVRGFLALPNENGDPERTAVYNLDHRILTTGQGLCHRLSLVVADGEWLDGPHEGCSEVAEGVNRALADWWIIAHDASTSVDEITMGDCLPLASQNP